MELGHVVYKSGARQDYLYFPTTAVTSLLYVTEEGSSTEIALAGREGAVGVALFIGGDSTPNRAVVQSAGVQRPRVSAAASGLQRRRLISYSRGQVSILSRRKLETVSCSCYRITDGIYRAALR